MINKFKKYAKVLVKVKARPQVSVTEEVAVDTDTPIMMFIDSISAMALAVIFIVSLISIIVVL